MGSSSAKMSPTEGSATGPLDALLILTTSGSCWPTSGLTGARGQQLSDLWSICQTLQSPSNSESGTSLYNDFLYILQGTRNSHTQVPNGQHHFKIPIKKLLGRARWYKLSGLVRQRLAGHCEFKTRLGHIANSSASQSCMVKLCLKTK